MNRKFRAARRCAALLTMAVLAAPAAADAQDPGTPPPADAPFSAKLTVPGTATKAALKKGIAVRVRCSRDCSARLSLAGSVGIVTQTSAQVPARRKQRIVVKVAALHLDVLKPGQKLTLSLRARAADDGALAHSRKKIRIR